MIVQLLKILHYSSPSVETTTLKAGHGHSNAANVVCIIVGEPRMGMVPAEET